MAWEVGERKSVAICNGKRSKGTGSLALSHGTNNNALDNGAGGAGKRAVLFPFEILLFSFLYFLYEIVICLHHLHH